MIWWKRILDRLRANICIEWGLVRVKLTLAPICARVYARFTATVDFPTPARTAGSGVLEKLL